MEARRLREAILRRASMMVCGPAGIGKSALVSKVIAGLPADLAARCLYFHAVKDLQDLLRQIVRALYRAKNPKLRQQLRTEGITSFAFEAWLKTLPSSRLRGTLFRSIEDSDYRVFLDHLPRLTPAVARVIKELFWMRNTPVYLLPLDSGEAVIGQFGHFFYWGNQERLVLGALPTPAARELLESCIERFALSHLDLTGFREETLELSKQVPGAIVKMCALAADPRYQYGSQIKTKSVYIDYLISGHELSAAALRQSVKP